ncbi:MAG: Sua5/YciO/YrdC/YwlC family protein [Sinobacterium sp.]|nr:Sua5/YciO/YrdC/YwlC family protein [Sinobacterium sp.]
MRSSYSAQQSARHLNQGGLLAYPTEGVWGLGCNPFDEDAVQRLLQLKSRDAHKGFILLFPSKASLEPYLLDKNELNAIQDDPDRSTTYIVDVNHRIPASIKGEHKRLAVRICTHTNTQAILSKINYPLVSTSLNPQGMQAAKYSFQVYRYFSPALRSGELAISRGSIGSALQASRIYDIQEQKILRN